MHKTHFLIALICFSLSLLCLFGLNKAHAKASIQASVSVRVIEHVSWSFMDMPEVIEFQKKVANAANRPVADPLYNYVYIANGLPGSDRADRLTLHY